MSCLNLGRYPDRSRRDGYGKIAKDGGGERPISLLEWLLKAFYSVLASRLMKVVEVNRHTTTGNGQRRGILSKDAVTRRRSGSRKTRMRIRTPRSCQPRLDSFRNRAFSDLVSLCVFVARCSHLVLGAPDTHTLMPARCRQTKPAGQSHTHTHTHTHNTLVHSNVHLLRPPAPRAAAHIPSAV